MEAYTPSTFALAALKDLSFSVLVILIKTYAVFKHLFRFFVKEDLPGCIFFEVIDVC